MVPFLPLEEVLWFYYRPFLHQSVYLSVFLSRLSVSLPVSLSVHQSVFFLSAFQLPILLHGAIGLQQLERVKFLFSYADLKYPKLRFLISCKI